VRRLAEAARDRLVLAVVALGLAGGLVVLAPAAAVRAAGCVPHPAVTNAFPTDAPVSAEVGAAVPVGSLPQQVVIDGADVRGYAYVADSGDDTVSVIATRAPLDASIAVVARLPSGGQIPSVIAVDGRTGLVYVGNDGTCTVGVIAGRAAGGPRLIASVGVGVSPTAVAVGGDGRVYVLGSDPDGIVVISPDAGAAGPSAGPADFGVSAPVTPGFPANRKSLVIAPGGKLAVAGGDDELETIDISGPLPVVVASTQLSGIWLGLTFDPSSDLLYAADNLFDTIATLRFAADGRTLGPIASVPAAAVIDPRENVNPVGLLLLPVKRELIATSYSTETPPTAHLTVFALDPGGALTIARTIQGIDHSTALALDPVTGRVLTTEREANRISVLDLETPTPLDLAFVLPGPFDLSLTPADIARNLGLTLLVILLIGAPTPLFNSTLDANEDEIRRWLRRRFHLEDRARPLNRLRNRWLGVGIYVLIAALLYAFLDPKFPFDDQVVAFGSALITLVVATSASILPGDRYVARTYHEHGVPRAALWTLGVAIVCVTVTRLTAAEPGYIYGIIGGFAFATSLTIADRGRMAFRGGLVVLAVGFAAWFLRIPFEPQVGQPQDAGVQLVNKVLEGLFVGSIQGLVFGLVPLRFLSGASLRAWSARRWVLLWGVGLALFIGVVLYPVSSYEPHPSDSGLVTMVITVLVYGLIAVVFWDFFRRRARRAAVAASPPDRAPAPGLQPVDPAQEPDRDRSEDDRPGDDQPEAERLLPGQRRPGLAHPEEAAEGGNPGKDHRHAGQPLHDH
jgi:DNA-binding beta-propeller fold protein YncE